MEVKGLYTALVTPFNRGAVDFGKLRELLEIQIASGVDGVVPMGTTGESPTLSTEEHAKVIETVIDIVDQRCVVMAGTGANSTAEAIELTKRAKKAGADLSLQVTPYYNKPTQEGLYRHFSAIADETGLPCVLYNVPGRSGVPISIETIARLSANDSIVAVKEAGGSVDRVSAILNVCNIDILSGDDSLALPMMSLGAKGVISVASNIIPSEMKMLVSAFAEGDLQKAQELHFKYYSLFNDMFIETNPIPVKAAMALKGIIEEEYRLPLCPLSDSNRDKLKETLKEAGVL